MTSIITPEIANNGYELCTVRQFLGRASDEHVARYRRNCIGKGDFVIWDPNGGADSYMLCLPTIAQLNREFLEHFAGYLAEDQVAS